MIRHLGKLKAIVSNARTVSELIAQYGSFGNYLAKFETVPALAFDLSGRFAYLSETTTEDFLRNVGFDTAKPDRHLTRWLERMKAIHERTLPKQVLEVARIVANAACLSRANFDSAIYLFCADRRDVISGGICGKRPDCIRCPIRDFCPYNAAVQVNIPSQSKSSRRADREQPHSNSFEHEPKANTVWATSYPGKSLEEIKLLNPFACRSWLEEPFGSMGSRERPSKIEKLFAGQTQVDRTRIASLARNDGSYVAFRAIAHDHAIWKDGLLRRVSPHRN